MADEKNTTFNYLLNAMELAGQEKHPAKAGYAGKRKALMAHVRELERDAARYRFMRTAVEDERVQEALEQANRNPNTSAEIDAAVEVAMKSVGWQDGTPPEGKAPK